jgi:hypothetical protein
MEFADRRCFSMKLRSQNSVATALVLSFLVFYVSVPASAQTGHKYVRVTDADTQRAIKDAKVTIKDENGNVVTTGKTNASGMWDAHLKPGTYKIEVEKTGYGKAEDEFTIEAGATENNEFALRRVQKQSALETAWGLHTATFETPQGKIKVNVPDDMAAGDTISGTVIAEASGKTEAERAKNQDQLNGYVVEIENEKTPVLGKVFKWAVPVGLAGGIASVILRDPKGNEVARTNVPVNPTPPRPPSNWSNPPVCQTGRPMSIPGPNSVDVPTEVTIGGKTAPILAQSPRKIVAETPQGVLGKADIEVRKGDQTVHKGETRAIGIQLSATSTTLKRGQEATLTVTVRGLENLAPDEKVPVQLTNKTPAVVSVEGGDVQKFTITRGDPNLDPQAGIWTRTFSLTGIRPGGFEIFAFLRICEDECNPEGAVRNQRVEIRFTNVGWRPGEAETLVYLTEVLTYLPRRSVLGPGRAAREILRALPDIAMSRGFNVWARKCCQRCEKTWCFFWIIKNLEWVDHCSNWQPILSEVVRVGDRFMVGTREYTWEQIVQQVEDALRHVTCP